MRLKYLTYTTALASVVLFAACEEMDTMPEGSTVTEQQKLDIKEQDPSKSESSVSGAFMSFSTFMPNEESVGSAAHNDFGYPSIMLFTDCDGEDVVSTLTGYNWFSHSIRYTNRSVSSYIAQITWQDLYSYIFAANGIFSGADLESEDPTVQYTLANGYALRAFAYFQLAQLFQFNIVGHEDSPCVPIITEKNANDYLVNGAKRATVQEVYDLIYSDIDNAIELLSVCGVEPADKRYVGLDVAYGLRARINLVCQKWDAALADAESAIENSAATPASIEEVSGPTFSSVNESNWMWGIIINETDDVVSSGIVNWISHIGSLNYGYANYSKGMRISSKLYHSIAESDIRKGWWLNDTCYSANLNARQASYMKKYSYRAYTNVKFGPYNDVVGTATNANDIPLMRIEEMYLIKAEAELMSGKGDALATLTDFVKTYRDPEYSFTEGDLDLHQEIWRQRRIEFWGEGISWFDVMRLGTGIDRRNAGFESVYAFVIAGTDTKLLYPIPESEVQANPALSEADYNPTSPTPTAAPESGEEDLSTETINL